MHNLSLIFVYLQSQFTTSTIQNIQQILNIIFSLCLEDYFICKQKNANRKVISSDSKSCLLNFQYQIVYIDGKLWEKAESTSPFYIKCGWKLTCSIIRNSRINILRLGLVLLQIYAKQWEPSLKQIEKRWHKVGNKQGSLVDSLSIHVAFLTLSPPTDIIVFNYRLKE